MRTGGCWPFDQPFGECAGGASFFWEVVMISYEEASNLLSYEPETGELRWRVSRPRAKAGSVAGCTHPNGYILVRALGRLYAAHRLAWLITRGSWPSDQLDHVNGIRHDNRLANLRECSNAENSQNQALRRTNTSGFVGVSWKAQNRKWRARIKVHGKDRHLGLYATPEQAYEAYLAAKAELHDFQPSPRS